MYLFLLIMLGISACGSHTTTPDLQSVQPTQVKVNQAKLQQALSS